MVLIILQRLRIMLVKNSYGISAVLGIKQSVNIKENDFTGSALNRKKISEMEKERRKEKAKKKRVETQEGTLPPEPTTTIDYETGEEIQLLPETKLRSMSQRTKSKIRKKVMAFAQLQKKLTFITLTFVNLVADQVAVKILKRFLDNMKKGKEDFDYLWVAERQTNNEVFGGNIHFHLITDKFWDIKKVWKYWIELQAKSGIHPRDENFKPSSAFDVKRIASKNPRSISSYLTKYITKNMAQFNCQVWNCSQGVSNLYTGFYTGMEFLEELQRLKGNQIKEIPMEYTTLHLIPLDKTTYRFYDRLKEKNQSLKFKQNNL